MTFKSPRPCYHWDVIQGDVTSMEAPEPGSVLGTRQAELAHADSWSAITYRKTCGLVIMAEAAA